MATFDGYSSVTFDELELRAHVSRAYRTAGVFRVKTRESVGALIRQVEGQIDWKPCDNRPCPIEVFDVVCTMI